MSGRREGYRPLHASLGQGISGTTHSKHVTQGTGLLIFLRHWGGIKVIVI